MTKIFIAKIQRKEGYLYFVDKEGIVWGKKLNKGMSKKAHQKIKKKKEEKYF